MPTSVPRIQCTPQSQLSHDMTVKLAELKGCSASNIVSHALEIWLRDNYEKEMAVINFYTNKEEN